MGNAIAKLFNKMFAPAQSRILVLGYWGVGKSTILHKLKLGEVVTTIPTIGFQVLTVEYKNISFTSWSVGGRDKIRPLWRHYYQNTDALIWVVDSTNKESLNDESRYADNDREELHRTLAEDELKDIKLLVFANKQDLPNAMSVNEISEKLGLNELRNRQWHIQSCSAKTGDGLYEGLDWLSNSLSKNKNKK